MSDVKETVAHQIPLFARVVQEFTDDSIPDPAASLKTQLLQMGLKEKVKPGDRLAICAGSRGIFKIAELTRAVVEVVKGWGTEPFVVPAMGSHGGATPRGQLAILASYGITSESMGCPIVTEMDVVDLGPTPSGCPVYLGRAAYQSQGIVVINRVKPHTILTGELGSGLMKMLALGLGKAKGAEVIHAMGLETHMIDVAKAIISKAPVLGGVALVENSFDRTARIEALLPDAFEEADKRLLKLSWSYLPNIPFDPIDVLIVRHIGKNISGTGMDPNVIGMHRRLGGPPAREIGRIVALDLTEESHGNAMGVGMADIITERLKARIDYEATYINAINSVFFWGIKMPIALPSDREALELAFRGFTPETVRSVLIQDTAHLDTMLVSQGLAKEMRRHPSVLMVEELRQLPFDGQGNLTLD